MVVGRKSSGATHQPCAQPETGSPRRDITLLRSRSKSNSQSLNSVGLRIRHRIAIERVLPVPFEATEQPGDWVLFKATGLNTMHRVLADCLPIMIQRGARLADADQYEKLLADLTTLVGRVIEPDSGEEGEIYGAEFWRSGSVASQYTGRYGTDRLVGMIRGLIAKTQSEVAV